MKKNSGQGIVEYLIIFAFLIAAFVLVGRMLQPKVHGYLNQMRSATGQ